MTHCKTSPTTRKPLSSNQLRAMGGAIDRWLRDKRNSQRTWDRLLAACQGVHSQQIAGDSALAEMVRLWLRYREAERRTHSRDGAIDEFNQAYTAWQTWKRRGS